MQRRSKNFEKDPEYSKMFQKDGQDGNLGDGPRVVVGQNGVVQSGGFIQRHARPLKLKLECSPDLTSGYERERERCNNLLYFMGI